jgi:hypothetical protein
MATMNTNSGKRITLRLTGLDEDDGDIRLNDFVLQLDYLKKALAEIQNLVAENPIAFFKITELSKNSPSLIVIEAVPILVEHEAKVGILIDKFFSSIDEIHNGQYPMGFTHDTFNAFKDLTVLKDKQKVKDLSISRNGENTNQLLDFSKDIEAIMGNDEYEYGSFTGMLDAINIHNQNTFYIYPTSHMPKLKCIFPSQLRGKAIAGVGRYVTVFGEKKLKPNISEIPYEMQVFDIEVHPSSDELPLLSSLKGIASSLDRADLSENIIRGIRNDW